jgi:hypothetical protein
MKKLFIVLIALLAFLAVSCNGQKERVMNRDREKESEPIRTANYIIPEKDIKKAIEHKKEQEEIFNENNITNLNEELNIGNGYVVSGHFDLDSFDQEAGPCLGVIYRKEYQQSYLYVLVDCHNNETRHIVRK